MLFGPRQRPKQPPTDDQNDWIHALLGADNLQ